MIPAIGIASGLGGSHNGSRQGPLLIQEHFSTLVDWKAMLHPEPHFTNKSDQITEVNQRLANETYNAALEHPFITIVGGDHSCAVGTWSGISEALNTKEEELAVLWIDAHMDSHTPETSPSGNIHGMPLAALLGYGSKALTQMLSPRPKVKPENVFLIGIRSYEEPERMLLESLNIRVYYVEEVLERGLHSIFTEIVDNLASRKVPYGLSLDIDFFDPKIMRATGTPEENGIHPQEFIDNYKCFDKHPPIAFEYVEFNPPQDNTDVSLEWTKKILHCALENRVPVYKNELLEITQ